MITLPTLYGKASNGKIKQWSISYVGDTYTVTYGQYKGKLQSKSTQCFPKNVGKKNETTGEQQAKLEAEAKWRIQQDKSYGPDINNIPKCYNPMLAQDYRKAGHRIDFPCYGQPKLNGVRVLARLSKEGEIIFSSRGGKTYVKPPQIVEELTPVFKKAPNLVLDGEFYIHNTPLEKINSAAKVLQPLTHKLEYHIFDTAREDLSFYIRKQFLEQLSTKLGLFTKTVETFLIENREDVEGITKNLTSAGYEGLILRDITLNYFFDTRFYGLQKYKFFLDKEFKIIGVKKDKNGGGVFICWSDDASQSFDCSYKGTHEQREHFWHNPDEFVGKWLTVQYQDLTMKKLPAFPVGVNFRDCNEKGEPLE